MAATLTDRGTRCKRSWTRRIATSWPPGCERNRFSLKPKTGWWFTPACRTFGTWPQFEPAPGNRRPRCDAEHPAFFKAMYGNEPAHWDDALTGMARLRAITNHLTGMRLLDAAGVMEFSHKGTLAQVPTRLQALVRLPVRLPGKIVFDHWAALFGVAPDHCHPRTRAWGVDTGCVWGRRLTALRLDDERLFSVQAVERRAA